MSELLLIALTAAIVSNFRLDRAGLAAPPSTEATIAIGAAVSLALAVGVAAEVAARRIAPVPYGLAHFAPLVSLLACTGAALVGARVPLRAHAVLAGETWLIAAVAALLALAVRRTADTLGTGLVEATASAGGAYCIALALLAGITARLERADVPERLRGPPLRLVAAALLSLAFMGFAGIAGL